MLISMADDDMCVKKHYDLSYEVQIDMKLHTGSSIHHIYQTDYRCGKSSTEAEMIAVSDHAGELIVQNEFYIHQCESNTPAIFYQDNHSTIILFKMAKARQIGRSI